MRFRYSIEKTKKNKKPVKKAVVYTQDEHGVDRADVDNDAMYIVERLALAGYETYIVGGAVRDLILGKKPKDFDIVSAASPSQIKKLFRNARVIGNRFRLVHVSIGEKIFEVATFRSIKEGPTGNIFGTIEEDVLRRDFSINALFYDPCEQLVVDYVGGMDDIKKRQIRPLISLKTIFVDDPVRMIRAVKYAATTGFSLPASLSLKIRQQSKLLAGISHSRLTEEIFKIIRSSSAVKIAESLEEFGLYQYLQPNASKLLKENSEFRERYFRTLATLNQTTAAPGENLAGLVSDFLELVVDWNGEPMETYNYAFSQARHFVLPMNPPRFEIEWAIKTIFKAHGILIKRTMFTDRIKRQETTSDR
ncbi:MAG: polynucleotide adenylyltransferase PcnB [Treponema sp.]|nr:polynucleotide adenylyltransferase PcnB [Treponema sp.]